MSQFLLYSKGEFAKNNLNHNVGGEQGVSKIFSLGEFSLYFSWFDKSNFKPYYDSSTFSFFCTGILYYENTRIDKKWDSLLGKVQREGVKGLKKLNGYGNLLIYNKEQDLFFIVTSRMGFMPIYKGNSVDNNKTAIGTHPDHIAEYLGANSLDKLSVAEFIATSCIAAPHTYYENIKQLEPASVYSFDGSKIQHVKKYWYPELDHNHFATESESAELIADFIKESVNKRITNNGKGLLLLSGGLDSRSVLFAPQNPSEMIEAVTFYNKPNTELKLASRLAKKAGVTHHKFRREYDYYGNLAIDTVKLTGGMWNIACFHTSGFDDELSKMSKGILLSGMYFDTFFKGFAFDKRMQYKKISGAIYKGYPAQDIYWDTRGANDLKNSYLEEIRKRRVDTYGYESVPEEELTPQMLNRIKYSRIGNMARIRSGGMDIALYKSQYYDMIVSDLNFSSVFSFLNPYDEIKNDFMKLVLKNLQEESVSVANSNDINSEFLMSNYYLTASKNVLQKRLNKILPNSRKKNIAVDSSWIDWYKYRRDSQLIRRLWKECNDYGKTREIVHEIMGYNPFEKTPDYSKSKYDFLNLLTVGLWLKYGYTD